MKEYLIWFAKFATVIIVIFFVIPLLIIGAGVAAGGSVQSVTQTANRVAVVELQGVIMDSKEVIKKLHELVNDSTVKGIVLRIDSPGGAVGPSQEIYSAVRELKQQKPIVASMGSVAASGGLYSALGASKIFAQSGTLTGSIGVIIQFPNLTKIANQIGFEMITVKSGALKDVGNTFRTMTPTDMAFLQTTVDSIYEEFLKAVVEGRGLNESEVRKFADGRILTGQQAKKLRLIDAFGGVYDAARSVYDLTGEPLPAGEYPELYYPTDKFEKLRKFMEAILDLPMRLQGTMSNPRIELLYMMQ